MLNSPRKAAHTTHATGSRLVTFSLCWKIDYGWITSSRGVGQAVSRPMWASEIGTRSNSLLSSGADVQERRSKAADGALG